MCTLQLLCGVQTHVPNSGLSTQCQSTHSLDAVPEGGASGVCGVPVTSTGPGPTLLLRGRGEPGTGQVNTEKCIYFK